MSTATATKDWADLRSEVEPESPAPVEQDAAYQPFPVDELPPVMALYAKAIGREMYVDPVMAALPMISVAGAAIGNIARARMSGTWNAPANIWSALINRSGEKKTPIETAVAKPLYEIQQKAAKEYAQDVAGYRQELERWKALPKKERGDAPTEPADFPHYYLSDSTTEATALRLLSQPRGLIAIFPELSSLFGSMNQYKRGGNDRESWLAFYDANAAKIDRKTSTPPVIFIPRAFVSVFGMIQPGILASCLGNAEFQSGMVARFLMAAPPPLQAQWDQRDAPDHIKANWNDLLLALLSHQLPEIPALIHLTNEAMSLWAKAFDRLEADRFNEPDDRMRAARAKLMGMIPRMALIFQFVSAASGECQPTIKMIDERSMQRAITIGEWGVTETRRVYGILANDADGSDDAIIKLIESKGGHITVRELMHGCRRFRDSAAKVENYLATFVDDGVGKWEWKQTGGRPSRVFVLHPIGNESPSNGHKNRDSFVTVTGKRDSKNGNGGGV